MSIRISLSKSMSALLALCATLMLLPAQAGVILSAEGVDDWERNCGNCAIELQYDVVYGEVIRLLGNKNNKAVIERKIPYEEGSPIIKWHWSLDQFVEVGSMISVVVFIEDERTGDKYSIEYVWDTSREKDTYTQLADRQYQWVVSSEESKALRWHSVSRDITQDMFNVTGTQMRVVAKGFRASLANQKERQVKTNGYFTDVRIDYLPRAPLSE